MVKWSNRSGMLVLCVASILGSGCGLPPRSATGVAPGVQAAARVPFNSEGDWELLDARYTSPLQLNGTVGKNWTFLLQTFALAPFPTRAPFNPKTLKVKVLCFFDSGSRWAGLTTKLFKDETPISPYTQEYREIVDILAHASYGNLDQKALRQQAIAKLSDPDLKHD